MEGDGSIMGTMTCDQCRRWWSPYLDSELDASKTFEVSEHLRVCESCRARFESEKDMDGWMRDRLRDVRMPVEMWPSIEARVRGEATAKASTKSLGIARWIRPIALAASVVLIVTAGVLWSNRSGPSESGGESGPQVAQAHASVVDLLEAATPEFEVFASQPEGNNSNSELAERLAADSRRLLGASIAFEMPKDSHHIVELVGVSERVDADGNTYLEMRLNCCGNPTLLVLSRSGTPTAITELADANDTPPKRYAAHSNGKIPIEVQSKTVGIVTIAGATASHQLNAVFSGIKVSDV